MRENLNTINISRFEDYYMVCNEGVYFRIGLAEGNILSKLVAGYSQDTIMVEEKLSSDEFIYILKEFKKHGIIGTVQKEKINPLHIKIALFSADLLLGKISSWLKRHHKIMMIGIVAILLNILVGILTIVIQYQDIFKVTTLILPKYQYVLIYFIYTSIIFCHELGHGIICKFFGGKVGKIGVAFILFNPAMYCDISDVRMFKEKYKQVLCSMAGFIVNAVFIGVFSFFYYQYKTNFFRVLIVLNATSILVNALPFVKLDGYWMLSFAVGIQNLYKKSIEKIKKIGKKDEFKRRKDYFILGYGILNCIIILYCCIQLIVKVLHIILTIL